MAYSCVNKISAANCSSYLTTITANSIFICFKLRVILIENTISSCSCNILFINACIYKLTKLFLIHMPLYC